MGIERSTTGLSRRRFLKSGFGLGALGVAGTSALVPTTAEATPAAAPSEGEGQRGWRFCRKCYGLFYSGFGTFGRCAAGGGHSGSPSDESSFDYHVAWFDPGVAAGVEYQTGWVYCPRCECLTWAPGDGWCPGGGHHVIEGTSLAYGVWHDWQVADPTRWQLGWRFCHKCSNIAFPNNGPGPCPAGGRHDHSGSLGYGFHHAPL